MIPSIEFFLAIILILITIRFIQQIKRKLKTKDVNVSSIPTVGCVEFFTMVIRCKMNYLKVFRQLRKNQPLYIFQIKWLNIKSLHVNDINIAKEMFQNPLFCGRPQNELLSYYARGNHGIMIASGSVWEEQRRFTMRRLRSSGIGTKSMEPLIAREVEDFIETLNGELGQVISPNKRFYLPIVNSLWMILTGQRYATEENELSRMLVDLYKSILKISQIPDGILLVSRRLPISVKNLQRILKPLPILSGVKYWLKSFENLRNFFKKLLDEKQKSLNMMDSPGDFVSEYLQEIEKTTNEKSTFYKDEGINNLLAVMLDFFSAGGETTATVLNWSMLHLIRNPEIQLKIQQEIDNVIGRERQPTLNDRANCPYIEAFYTEVLRMTPCGVHSFPHMTTQDVQIGPYLVEKGTNVYLNLAAIHFDENIWGDADNFRPERFLSPVDGSFVKNEAIVVFSLGRRQCPGFQLALDNLFCFISSICQKFTLRKDPTLKDFPPLDAESSVFYNPLPFKMVVEERQ